MSISSTGLYGSATIVNTDIFDDVQTLKEEMVTLSTSYLQTTAEHRTDISQNKFDISSNLSKITDLSNNRIVSIEQDIEDISNNRIVLIEADVCMYIYMLRVCVYLYHLRHMQRGNGQPGGERGERGVRRCCLLLQYLDVCHEITARYDEPRLVWTRPPHTSERGGEGWCVKGGWRGEGQRVRGEVCQ